jgi:hypothetical protein
VSNKKQELFTFREHRDSPPDLWWGSCCFLLVSIRSDFCPLLPVSLDIAPVFSSGVRVVHCVPIKLTATITKILLKVALNTISLILVSY